MFIEIESNVRNVLYELNSQASSILVGGYVRDKILGLQPSDVDIKTNAKASEIHSLFPFAEHRTSISGMDIFHFSHNKTPFEISLATENLNTYVNIADLTINALAHDGDNIIDGVGGMEDINKKVLRFSNAESFQKNILSSPPFFLKHFRLTATTGFQMDLPLIILLKENAPIISKISQNILSYEAYKILHSPFTLNSIHHLARAGIISGFSPRFEREFPMKKNDKSLHFLLVYYAFATSFNTIIDFIETFKLSKKIRDDFETSYDVIAHDKDTSNYRLLNEKILLNHLIKK